MDGFSFSRPKKFCTFLEKFVQICIPKRKQMVKDKIFNKQQNYEFGIDSIKKETEDRMLMVDNSVYPFNIW